MTEFVQPSATGLRKIIVEIERTTDHWERLANKPFDEEAKVGKLRELIPSNVWNYIAQSARSTRTCRELVNLAMNQLADPKTGMLQGEKSPTLNEVQFLALDAIGKGKGGFKGMCWNYSIIMVSSSN